jgi:hypothetical protein
VWCADDVGPDCGGHKDGNNNGNNGEAPTSNGGPGTGGGATGGSSGLPPFPEWAARDPNFTPFSFYINREFERLMGYSPSDIRLRLGPFVWQCFFR